MRERKIYAGVLTNRNYVVGSKNQGVGLFVGNKSGDFWDNVGFTNMRTFAIEIFPRFEGGLFYTGNGNGLFISRNGGASWRVTTGWEITEILHISVLPNKPNVIYIGTAYGLYKSEQFGENWQRLTKRFVNGLFVDCVDPNRIYLSEEDGLLTSQNSGRFFQKDFLINDGVNAFAQNQDYPDQIYAGTEDNGIYISHNRGKSWRQINDFKTATIYSLAIDLQNPNKIYASTFSDGILISNNFGKTWTSSKNGIENIAIYSVVIDPDHSNYLFAGTANHGIYRSTDHGKNWSPFALDGTHVLELEIK